MINNIYLFWGPKAIELVEIYALCFYTEKLVPRYRKNSTEILAKS